MDRAQCLLFQYYQHGGGWDEVQPVVQHMGSIYGQRTILVDRNGLVVADSELDYVGKQYDPKYIVTVFGEGYKFTEDGGNDS